MATIQEIISKSGQQGTQSSVLVKELAEYVRDNAGQTLELKVTAATLRSNGYQADLTLQSTPTYAELKAASKIVLDISSLIDLTGGAVTPTYEYGKIELTSSYTLEATVSGQTAKTCSFDGEAPTTYSYDYFDIFKCYYSSYGKDDFTVSFLVGYTDGEIAAIAEIKRVDRLQIAMEASLSERSTETDKIVVPKNDYTGKFYNLKNLPGMDAITLNINNALYTSCRRESDGSGISYIFSKEQAEALATLYGITGTVSAASFFVSSTDQYLLIELAS